MTSRIAKVLTGIVVLGICACVVVLVISVSRPHGGLSRAEIIGGYIIPGGGVVLGLIALRLPTCLRVNVVLVALSVMFGMYGIELVLAMGVDSSGIGGTASSSNGAIDRRQKIEVIRDMRERGNRVFPHAERSHAERGSDTDGRWVAHASITESFKLNGHILQ